MFQIQACLTPVLRLSPHSGLLETLLNPACGLNKPLHIQSLSFLTHKTDFCSNVAACARPAPTSRWNFSSIFILSWVITLFYSYLVPVAQMQLIYLSTPWGDTDPSLAKHLLLASWPQ